jgi:subtilisin-like proprotein convertase family protein
LLTGLRLSDPIGGSQEALAQSCDPRPPVLVSVTQQAPEQLKATITAGAGTIQQLRFPQSSATSNATAVIDGATRLLPTTYIPPSPSVQVQVIIVRTTIGGAVTVPVEVTDACGVWPTFVGRGPAGWPPTFTPTLPAIPTVPPDPTATPIIIPSAEYCSGAGLGLPIPDDRYDGTLESMAASSIVVADPGSLSSIRVRVAITHSYAGDLTLKLRSPTETVVTLVSRPGLLETADDGASPVMPGRGAAFSYGDSSNLLSAFPISFSEGATPSAEFMGAWPVDLTSDEVIGRDAGSPGLYGPSSGAAPSTTLSDLTGQWISGLWMLFIGDSAAVDTGTLDQWCVTITRIAADVRASDTGPTSAPQSR